MKNPFTTHPKSINETYFEHMFHAFSFGINMLIAGLACITHAIFPFLFEKTASNLLIDMTEKFVNRLSKVDDRITHLSKSIDEKIVACNAKK